MRDMPYFMSNNEWFEFDFERRMFILTALAPDKAKQSYEEYRKELKEGRGG